MHCNRLASAARSFCLPLAIVAVVGAAPAPSPSPRATPAPTPTPQPGEVRVSVWVGAGEKKSAAPGAVVWIPGSQSPDMPHGRISSKSKRFDPRVSAIPVGGTVDFPNLDKIHHNVFSLSEKAKFDLGLYRNGASKPMTFPNPGLVRIYCNIHPQMAAYLMVVDGKSFAVSGADGIAVLPGIRPGRHPLRAWEEKGGEWAGTVDVISGRTSPVRVLLDASAFREVPHTRKDGTGYPPPEDDENRY